MMNDGNWVTELLMFSVALICCIVFWIHGQDEHFDIINFYLLLSTCFFRYFFLDKVLDFYFFYLLFETSVRDC